jgi:hypothetical protein
MGYESFSRPLLSFLARFEREGGLHELIGENVRGVSSKKKKENKEKGDRRDRESISRGLFTFIYW